MSDPWATSGIDLHLDLTGPRVRAALENALREAVRTGRLHPGVRVPSSRALARDLQIARNTVAEAYSQLVGEGWLVAAQGSGTRVASQVPAARPIGSSAAAEVSRFRFDLRAGSPDLSAFPGRNGSPPLAARSLARPSRRSGIPTLAEFISSGGYDRHVRRRRLAYRRRRDRFVAELHRHAPQLQIHGIAAGLHALLQLADNHTEDEVVARAAQRGLAVEGLDAYRLTDQRHRPTLVIGYATPPDHAFTAALARLCAALNDPPRHAGK